jgi:F-type H+-transporting ATPase subunit b
MLEIDWVTILFEIINFLIITVVLYFLVFKPIVKRSEARAQEKARLMEELIADRQEAAKHLEEIETRLNTLDAEIEKITDEAYENNKVLQAELLSSTREEAERILQEALLEVRKEQLVGLKKHQSQVVDVVMALSRQALYKVSPSSIHNNLIEELTKSIWDLGKTDMRQVQLLRESLQDRAPVAEVVTAIPLTVEQKLNLIRTFSALADKDIDIDLQTDENLVAGLKVRIGDLIVENSLSAELESVRDNVNDSLEKIDMHKNG